MSTFIKNDIKLCKLLGIKNNKRYSMTYIKEIIKNKALSPIDINIFFPSIKCCNCGECSINNERLIKYIEENYIESKPINMKYYEYEQQPIKITNMVFE